MRARRSEGEKADFLVDYKRFTPRVTKAFTEGDIVHVVEDDRSHSLVAPAGPSEFLTTPSDGHEDRLSLYSGISSPPPLAYFIR